LPDCGEVGALFGAVVLNVLELRWSSRTIHETFTLPELAGIVEE
jgi:hypothetical protein